jgi:hypothetical protein
MPGVFDRLQKELKIREQVGGISPMDIADLPPPLRKILRLMLREIEMAYPVLCAAMAALPEADRMKQPDLDKALATLTKQGWLIRFGEEQLTTYRVNLRRKAGSTLGPGLWTSLRAKIDENKEG